MEHLWIVKRWGLNPETKGGAELSDKLIWAKNLKDAKEKALKGSSNHIKSMMFFEYKDAVDMVDHREARKARAKRFKTQ